jgi:multiple sugar transport system ATP-binding protein
MASITLDRVTKRYPNGVVAVDAVDLHIADGEFMVLVGPSGCGKSTLLRLIAGLEEITDGGVLVGERDITYDAPKTRDIAMVFQNYALYPHMTVRRNLGLGLKLHKVPKARVRERVDEVARMLELTDLLERKPAQLSGGQRQRVAMGRALVREPQAFLMDEPLSNLDAQLRVAMREELARLHRQLGTTTVYVTHDQVEAMTLGTRVAVMRNGVLQQCATPDELYRTPSNVFCAAFVGSPQVNFVDAVLDGDRIQLGTMSVQAPARLASSGRRPVLAAIRPSTLRLGAGERAGESVSAVVDLVENLGSQRHVWCTIEAPPCCASCLVDQGVMAKLPDGAEARTRWVTVVEGSTRLEPGDRIDVHVAADDLLLFDPETGLRLDA